MARKPFEFDNPVFLDVTNMEEDVNSEKISAVTPAPSPKILNKRSRSLNETESAYQDLVNVKVMYQPLKKQGSGQDRELPAVPLTPRNRRCSEPVVMLTHCKAPFGRCPTSFDSSSAAKSKTKYLEPIDSSKSFRDRINSSIRENSEVFVDVGSRQANEGVDKAGSTPKYFVLEQKTVEENAENRTNCYQKKNGQEKKKRTSNTNSNNVGELHNNNANRNNRTAESSGSLDAADNPYYHVLEIPNQTQGPRSERESTSSCRHRILSKLSARVRNGSHKTYVVSTLSSSSSCNNFLVIIICCILLFSVVTCVMTVLVIQGKIEAYCVCGGVTGSSSSVSAPVAQAVVSDKQLAFIMAQLNNTRAEVHEEKEKSRSLADQVKNLTQQLRQIYNLSRGPPGPPGPQGLPGAQGQRGPQGHEGAAGMRGPRGFNGSEGARGEQGPSGYNGSRGFPGIQGPPGVNGSRGGQGPQGPKGAVVDFGSCVWKSEKSSSATRSTDVVVEEPKGKRIVSVTCSTSSLPVSVPGSFRFDTSVVPPSNAKKYTCTCVTDNDQDSFKCIIHYCECPIVT